MCADSNFESAEAAPGAIHEEPPAAIDASNVSETAIAQDSLAITTSDGTAIIEARADFDVYRDGMSGDWRSYRYEEAGSQAKACEQKTTHQYSPCQRACLTSIVIG
ncbi:hypothetical protein [Mesorhizobium wenxiniae]|uniref:hypothetical protein n=1 Tax=Mesorhizobium wenxiniae TaxID=2014805 RepID=UPI0013FDF71E|nr:hypothetical protein [Mesorhizobium wenxiniae]